ncbi:hypothetical protein [Hyunsoonleella pacifica]|uniref:Uncharacterized protein n=1 Tax=Hyunsoonleella pacifica TaxID=1080224 RepID=A0A4Q9FLQ9_9FLAO|nr:hypothetical protein [Hyunsoonleella pacifica]TBN14317.1 hypothetical protein EYD46_12125 [Hyunsoonleella pacifica]
MDFSLIQKKGEEVYAFLFEKHHLEQNKYHLNSEKVKIAEYFNDSIIRRLLWLVNKLISNQNIIFDK